jgi:hypothetical protein
MQNHILSIVKQVIKVFYNFYITYLMKTYSNNEKYVMYH